MPDRLGEILIRQGLITPDQLAQAVEIQRRKGGLVGEVLVGLGHVDEATVLRGLAEQYGVSYVTRKQVAENLVPKSFLAVVPLEEAERHLVFPVWYNKSSGELVLIVSDPTDRKTVDAVRSRTQVPVITTILALPSTIRAAIDKHYRGVSDAFDRALDDSVIRLPPPPPLRPAESKTAVPPVGGEWQEDVRRLAALRHGSLTGSHPGTEAHEPESPHGDIVALYEPDAARARTVRAFLQSEGYRARPVIDREQLAELVAREPPQVFLIREEIAKREAGLTDWVQRLVPHVKIRSVGAFGEALVEEPGRVRQLIDSLIEVLEKFLKGVTLDAGRTQSGPSLPRIARQVGQRLGLGAAALDELTVAAYMHQLARDELAIPSVVDVAPDTDKTLLLEQVRIPIHWLVHLDIPVPADRVLAHLYERVDGEGFPEGRSGDEIPLGARILTAVIAFQRLAGDRIPDDKSEIATAFRRLVDGRGKLYDARVLNTFLEVLEKGLLLGEIDVDLDKVLLVDPDAEFAESLASHLLSREVRVLRAPSFAKARELIRDYEPELVVSEVHLPDGDPLAFLSGTGAAGAAGPTVMFVTAEQSQATMGQALERGAEDYVLKIVGEKVLLAKIERVLERVAAARSSRARAGQSGVSGRLSEMSLADIIQILATGGKTARIALVRGGDEGSIWLRDGTIVHAEAADEQGEEAFYRVIGWNEGEFQIATGAIAPLETIDAGYESLVLEGLRRLDEARAESYDEAG